jgi:hypothetical protein
LCALPPDTLVNCPADFGVRYRLVFISATRRFGPISADPAGCSDVTGLRRQPRLATAQFWMALAKAMGLARPGINVEDTFQPRPHT